MYIHILSIHLDFIFVNYLKMRNKIFVYTINEKLNLICTRYLTHTIRGLNFFKIVSIITGLGIQLAGMAQETDSAMIAYQDYRSEYVQDETQQLGLSVFTRSRTNQMAVRGTQRLEYYPNDVSALGVRIQHKWLGVALTYSPKFLQPQKKGETTELDLHVYIYARRHNLDAYYFNYSGLYIDNYQSNAILKEAFKEEYPLLPDMRLEGAGINYFYVLNHKKYSLRSSYLHNEIQKKSAGSFLMGTSVNYLHFGNPSSILPNQLDSVSQPKEKLENGDFYVASVLPGYAHTFVFRRIYFTIAPMIGVAFQYQNFAVESESHTTRRFSASARSLARFGVGYNAERFYIGVTAVSDSYNYRLSKGVTVEMRVSDARLIVGYRFAPRGFVKKVSDKMDNLPIHL